MRVVSECLDLEWRAKVGSHHPAAARGHRAAAHVCELYREWPPGGRQPPSVLHAAGQQLPRGHGCTAACFRLQVQPCDVQKRPFRCRRVMMLSSLNETALISAF